MSKHIDFFDKNGNKKLGISVKAIHTEPMRSQILQIFTAHPDFAYFETNVRRYTAGDIYAGHRGQAI